MSPELKAFIMALPFIPAINPPAVAEITSEKTTFSRRAERISMRATEMSTGFLSSSNNMFFVPLPLCFDDPVKIALFQPFVKSFSLFYH